MALREHRGVGAQRAPWWCVVWMIPLRVPIPGDPGCATSGAAPKAFSLALSKGILWVMPGNLLSSTPRGSLQRGSARRPPLPGRLLHFLNYFTFPLEFFPPFSTRLQVKETGGGLSPPDVRRLRVPSNPPRSSPPFFAQNPQQATVAPCACRREETRHPPRTSPFPISSPQNIPDEPSRGRCFKSSCRAGKDLHSCSRMLRYPSEGSWLAAPRFPQPLQFFVLFWQRRRFLRRSQNISMVASGEECGRAWGCRNGRKGRSGGHRARSFTRGCRGRARHLHVVPQQGGDGERSCESVSP